MSKNIEMEFTELASGGLQEKLEGELKKIFDNIHDLNTDPKAKRGLTIKFEFKPDSTRQVVAMKTDFLPKLAPVEGIGTMILTGRNIETGMVEAKELKSEAPGQTYIDPDDGEPKTDTGELIRNVENDGVIDLQKKRG